jgi:hypothetical protein
MVSYGLGRSFVGVIPGSLKSVCPFAMAAIAPIATVRVNIAVFKELLDLNMSGVYSLLVT